VLIVLIASFAQSPFLEIRVFVLADDVIHMMAAMMTMTTKMILKYNINFKISSIVCSGMHVLSVELEITLWVCHVLEKSKPSLNGKSSSRYICMGKGNGFFNQDSRGTEGGVDRCRCNFLARLSSDFSGTLLNH
jgi:hypothetical protein